MGYVLIKEGFGMNYEWLISLFGTRKEFTEFHPYP